MIAKVMKFFRPETEIQQLQRIVVILSAAVAVCFVSLMVYGFKHPPTTSQARVDKIGMLILLDDLLR